MWGYWGKILLSVVGGKDDSERWKLWLLLCLVKANEGESALGLALTVHWVCRSLVPSPPQLSACVSVTCCHGLAVFCPPASLTEAWRACVLWATISLCSLPQSVADASWITELLWTFFVPFTVYQVRYYLSLSLSFVWGRI